MVIPTVAAMAVRHFRHTNDNEPQIQPKHPAVRFLLGAWNEGDFSDSDKHIAPDCGIYTNGLALEGEHAGPAMIQQAVESWRAMVPDLTMELALEIADKHHIAIKFRITGTRRSSSAQAEATGGAIDGSAFLMLDHGKILEIWTVFDSLALAALMGPTEPPSRWPGTSEGP